MKQILRHRIARFRNADDLHPVHSERRLRPVATMLRLTQKQRTALSETFRQLANVAAATLAFGQFVSQRPVSIVLVATGLTVWAALVGLGIWFAGGDDNGRRHD
jgi:hypothetical protein